MSWRRRAMFVARASRVCSSCCEIRPDAVAASHPPAASICWNHAHAARARSLVSDSMYHEPPPGSITRAAFASSINTAWVLRAKRRANPSGSPIASSKGNTVIESAPPTPAAKQATVARKMFTQGSRWVSIARDVTACCRIAEALPDPPHTSATLAHRRRAARIFAIVENWSLVAARRNSIWSSAASMSSGSGSLSVVSARRYVAPTDSAQPSSSTSEPPRALTALPSTTSDRTALYVRETRRAMPAASSSEICPPVGSRPKLPNAADAGTPRADQTAPSASTARDASEPISRTIGARSR